jgi:hypothetical protein
MYENGKMKPVETIPGMGRGGIKISVRIRKVRNANMITLLSVYFS